MKNLTSNEIRKMWLSFFKSKGHKVIEGASLVPLNDKTLLWINSGVAALKQYFDGSKATSDRRLVNVQKSIRTNDIENVGNTNRHHTFFEMLGNFSIGDYFRREAITWGFEFLTSETYLGLPLERLYFTYHPSDEETRKLWISLGVPASHTIPNTSNFWEIGEGPCGPNTEIFFDLGEEFDPLKRGPEMLENDIDNDRFLEIWNIVFSQYNAKPGLKREEYKELPSKNIDTGAGLERIASVLQNASSNFETDLFMPIMNELSVITNTTYLDNKVAYRVIADHIRTATFALSDGASFANEGRGYVLRRLLRRAVRFGKKIGMTEPFLYKLVPIVVAIMEDFYPYLNEKKDHVMKLIKAEEVRFLNTLSHGEDLLRSALENSSKITGELAFKMYDTFGFPLEITMEIAHEKGATVDVEGFEERLENQREKARSARKNDQSMASQSEDLLKFTSPSKFLENSYEIKAKVIALFKEGVSVNESDDYVSVIVDQTPFYSESGGQVSDVGFVYNEKMRASVVEMGKAPHGQHLHHLTFDYGSLSLGDEVTLVIDRKLRRATMQNHSATHFLHKALNVVLGPEVSQAGSYVGPDYLRFDFNYNVRISKSELAEIETLVNNYVADAIPLSIKFMSVEEAKKMGAKALFMEKYGDLVRVVMFDTVSIELCGGTHVANSAEIGSFVIVSESSVASGVRRIVALSGLAAYDYLKNSEHKLELISESLGIKDQKEIVSSIRNLKEKYGVLENKVKAFHHEKLQEVAKTIKPAMVNDVKLFISIFSDLERGDLASISDKIRSEHDDAIVLLITIKDDMNALLVSISKPLVASYNAGKMVKSLTTLFGGSGGGRPDFANGVVGRVPSLDNLTDSVKKVMNG